MSGLQSLDSVLKAHALNGENFISKIGYLKKEEDSVRTTKEYWLSDKNRLAVVTEIAVFPPGLFSSIEYEYIFNGYDLNYVSPENITVNHRWESTGWFSSHEWNELCIHIPINGIYNDMAFELTSSAYGIEEKIRKHMEEYGQKSIPSNGNQSYIGEVRKMYEDRLITKEEMLDLISKFAQKL
jgi:hypothetical protein